MIILTMAYKSNTRNRQVQRTRSWIFEALMLLLDEKPYRKIGILDITEKAGIARQTFYRNFNNKDDIVSEYLMNTISFGYTENNDSKPNIVLKFNFKYMLEHNKNIKKLLSIVDIQHRIRNNAMGFPVEILEQYKKKMTKKEYLFSRYKFYYQMIGCLHVFFDWFVNDMPIPVDEIITMLNTINISDTNQYSNIPNLLVSIDEG
jgi:hypothetical protein